MKFSEKIKYIRQRLNMNQKEFAKILHIMPVTLGRYELEERTPDLNFLENFISTLSLNPMWLFYDSGDCFLKEDDLDLSDTSAETLKDLRLLLTQEELNIELNEVLIKNILKRFEIINNEQSTFYKFLNSLKFEGHLPIRPFLFLYYIFQYIEQDSNKDSAKNYKEYLLDIVFSFKTLSWNNNPIFTKKIKTEISTKFDEEITEKECQLLVTNAHLTLKRLEEIMPKGMLKYHNKVHLKSLFPNKF